MRRIVLLAVLVAAACSTGPSGGAPTADEVRRIAGDFSAVVAAVDEAWNSESVEAIRQVYTEDVVHHDDTTLNHIEGIDGVTAMAATIFSSVAEFTAQSTSPVYIGRDAAVGVAGTEGVFGVLGATEEGPLLEIDLLEIREGRVAYWTLFYFGEQFGAPGSLPAEYAAAWSSGDPEAVGRLYAPTAVRVDSLFGEQAEGREAIEDAAAAFFERHPAAGWELELPFGDRGQFTEPAPRGGIYGIRVTGTDGEPCVVMAAVVVDTTEEGIVAESLYYEADSLLACGWAD